MEYLALNDFGTGRSDKSVLTGLIKLNGNGGY